MLPFTSTRFLRTPFAPRSSGLGTGGWGSSLYGTLPTRAAQDSRASNLSPVADGYRCRMSNLRRWLPAALAVLFALLWWSATRVDDTGTQTAPDLAVPFAVLALAATAWAVIERRRA